jgi:hypothetical protein
MITVKAILRAIGNDKLELFRGNGYYYFTYDDLEVNKIWADESVYVCRLNHLDLNRWIEIGKEFINKVETENNIKGN